MALIKCPECGREISDKASSCPSCGCPIESQKSEIVNNIVNEKIIDLQQPNKSNKKNMLIIAIIAVLVVIGILVYNFKVIRPKTTYNEAISLLEKGKYEEGNELLHSIIGYKDVDTILEQIKWESRVYECITEIRQYLKNPDSLQVYDVNFYDGYKSDLDETKKNAMETFIKLGGGEPICVMHRGGQNGFGGNTTGYSLFLYSDGVYKYMGSCNSLDENEIDDDQDELMVCGLINAYKDNLETVGDVDLARIKAIIKNDSYSTIKIIE